MNNQSENIENILRDKICLNIIFEDIVPKKSYFFHVLTDICGIIFNECRSAWVSTKEFKFLISTQIKKNFIKELI